MRQTTRPTRSCCARNGADCGSPIAKRASTLSLSVMERNGPFRGLPMLAGVRYCVIKGCRWQQLPDSFSSEAHSVWKVSTGPGCAAKSLTSQLEDFLECI